VEVRIPTPSTATGQDGRQWSKLLTSVSERAKTGHDWAGSWLDTGRLVDLPIGSLVITGGSTGSRKHPTKVATLYVVDPDGDLIQIMHVEHDEWAVKMRVKAREYLAMDPLQRPVVACQRKAKWYREEATPATEGSYLHMKLQRVIESGGYSPDAQPNSSYATAYGVGGYLPPDIQEDTTTRSEMLAKGMANAQAELATIEAKIAEERAELLSQTEEWERHAERFRAMLTPRSTPTPDPSPEPTITPTPTPPVTATQERRGDSLSSPGFPRFTVEQDGQRVVVMFRSRADDTGLDQLNYHSLSSTEAQELSRMLSEATERSGT
jgi:hypothetical protein